MDGVFRALAPVSHACVGALDGLATFRPPVTLIREKCWRGRWMDGQKGAAQVSDVCVSMSACRDR